MVYARKYRPKTLKSIIGQPAVVQTLSNAITRNHLHHAYLFVGKFGTGKTSTARVLAASENCKNSPGLEPCGKCDLCVAVFAGNHTDISEIDAASSAGKVEQIRELKNAASYSPIDGAKTKYFIIDECHRMSAPGEEALLKLIEEPPSHVRFVLCTTELQQMRGTILSRCQVHEFRKIYWREIVQQLENVAKAENIHCDVEALQYCAKFSDGSMRNALQNLEKVSDFAGDKPITMKEIQVAFGVVAEAAFYNLMDAATDNNGPPDATQGYKIINEIFALGTGFASICDGISEVLRTILVGVTTHSAAELINISEESKKRLIELMKRCKPKIPAIIESLKYLTETRTAVDYGLSAEIALQVWFLDTLICFRTKEAK